MAEDWAGIGGQSYPGEWRAGQSQGNSSVQTGCSLTSLIVREPIHVVFLLRRRIRIACIHGVVIALRIRGAMRPNVGGLCAACGVLSTWA